MENIDIRNYILNISNNESEIKKQNQQLMKGHIYYETII